MGAGLYQTTFFILPLSAAPERLSPADMSPSPEAVSVLIINLLILCILRPSLEILIKNMRDFDSNITKFLLN